MYLYITQLKIAKSYFKDVAIFRYWIIISDCIRVLGSTIFYWINSFIVYEIFKFARSKIFKFFVSDCCRISRYLVFLFPKLILSIGKKLMLPNLCLCKNWDVRRVYFDIWSSFDKIAKKIAGGGLKMMRTRHALTQHMYVLYMRESLHRHDVCRKSRNSVPTTAEFYGFLRQYTASSSRRSNHSSIQLTRKIRGLIPSIN